MHTIKEILTHFLKPPSDDIKVYQFPNNLEYEGLGNMRNRYEGFF